MARLAEQGRRLLLAAGIGLAAGSALAQQAVPAQVRETMALSGMNASIEQLPGLVEAQLEMRKDELSSPAGKRFEAAMRDAFRADRLKTAAESALAARYHAAVFGAGLKWLRSPLGAWIAKLEMAMGTDAGQAAYNAWEPQLQSDPPSRGRVRMITRLMLAMKSVGAVVEATLVVSEPIIQASNLAAPRENRRSEAEIKPLLDAMREHLTAPVAQQTIMQDAFTYRDLSDAELEQYVSFLESKPGTAWYDAMNESVTIALQQAAARVKEQFSAIFEP